MEPAAIRRDIYRVTFVKLCVLCSLWSLGSTGNSILQRHDRLPALAEGRDMLQFAIWPFHQHHRTITEHGMTAFGHIPDSAFTRMLYHGKVDRRTQRRRHFRTG